MMSGMWMWGALGLVLLAVEMATGTVYLLWFGISALSVAVLLGIVPALPLALQFLMFSVISVISLAIWKIKYKKTDTHSRVGQSQGEEIGRTGTVTVACGPNQLGKIEFAQGLMGSREWAAVANADIAVNATACVIAVEGNSLRIQQT